MSVSISGGRLAAIGAATAIAILCAIGAAQAQTGATSGSQAQQPSPQGQTGPVNTGAGGAPPESPQGETPPNMQATSPSSKEAPKGK